MLHKYRYMVVICAVYQKLRSMSCPVKAPPHLSISPLLSTPSTHHHSVSCHDNRSPTSIGMAVEFYV